MTNQENNVSQGSYQAMWGIPSQLCCHGNAMVAQTTKGEASVEALLRDFVPQILNRDLDMTAQVDRRLLGEIEPAVLLRRARTNIHTNPELRLPADFNQDALVQKTDGLKAMAAGQKPQLREEILRSASLVCREAACNLRRTFDAVASRAPSQVDSALEDLLKAMDEMAPPPSSERRAMAQLERRAEQLEGLGRLRAELKETSFETLRRRLLQNAQQEYRAVLDEIIDDVFRQCWQQERNGIKERCQQHLEDRRAYQAKCLMCVEQVERAMQLAKERLATLEAGNQIVLGEPSGEQLLASIMAGRRVGSQAELLDGLRHDLEDRLREIAAQRGMAGQEVAFRRLILAIPVNEVIDTFRRLVVKSLTGLNSFYESCQAYGLREVVTGLAKRSRITSWFNGCDDARHGITRFELNIVRMPAARNPKDVEIKEIMEAMFRQEGFDHIVSNGHDQSISVLRIYAGWPVGIEGGNPALLEAYGRSRQTNHLPHLVGILPDTHAGEHAPGILKLLGPPSRKE